MCTPATRCFPIRCGGYELTSEKVDCLIFGSKNYAPVLDRIHEITERFHTYFYYTVTAYGKDIEPGVPDIDSSIDTFLQLSKIVGIKRLAWRYDPILLISLRPCAAHNPVLVPTKH